MGNPVGHPDDPNRWKPDNLRNYLTLGELSKLVKRDKSSIRRAEAKGYIPKPVRHKIGRLRVRLYSPEECDKVVKHFKTVKFGPKPKEVVHGHTRSTG